MWICFNDGFVSAVVSDTNPNNLIVRARRLEDLENVIGEGHVIYTNAGTDYKYRAEISKEDFAYIVAHEVENINYTNFKSSVKDIPLHNLYIRMWRLHRNYQK